MVILKQMILKTYLRFTHSVRTKAVFTLLYDFPYQKQKSLPSANPKFAKSRDYLIFMLTRVGPRFMLGLKLIRVLLFLSYGFKLLSFFQNLHRTTDRRAYRQLSGLPFPQTYPAYHYQKERHTAFQLLF